MNLFELFVKIGVDDQASGNLKKIGQSLGNGLKEAAKVGVAAVGAATAGIVALTKQGVESFAEYEQLAGGMEKIFSGMDISKIANDAQTAYKTMGMSANEYLAIINDVGASFASTMGNEAGYEAAKKGLQAISDYASGTGKNFGELQQKLALLTRSTSSYQSIADQFSGILPATSKGFLEQAQAAGYLSDKYKSLTEVPVAEYQQAVTDMLEKGVDALNLTGNTAAEASETLSGSVTAMKAAWENLVTGIADDNADMEVLIGNFVETLVGDGSGNGGVINNILPRIEQSLEGVGTLVDTMVPIIVDKVPTIVNEWLPKILESGISMVKTIFDGMMQNSGAITTGAVNIISTFASGISENLPSILVSAVLLIGEFAAGMAQALPDILAKVPEIVSGIVAEFAAHSGEFLAIGASIVNGILEGIGSMWASLEEHCSGLIAGLQAAMHFQITGEIVVPDLSVGVAHGGTSTAGKPSLSLPGKPLPLLPVDGSHAIGLDYVPFDGYIAELHKGERILTANEAYAYKNQKPSVSIVQNIYSESKTAADLMQEALYQQERAVLLGV